MVAKIVFLARTPAWYFNNTQSKDGLYFKKCIQQKNSLRKLCKNNCCGLIRFDVGFGIALRYLHLTSDWERLLDLLAFHS